MNALDLSPMKKINGDSQIMFLWFYLDQITEGDPCGKD